jgi:hypothetical protein
VEDKKKRVQIRKKVFTEEERSLPDALIMEMDMSDISPEELVNIFSNIEKD